MMSYHDFRKYLRETGPELITYEQMREIIDKRMKKDQQEYESRRKTKIKDCPLTRGEGFSFLLSKLLKKNKGGSLTLDEIKELKEKKAKAKEHFEDCCDKLGIRELVQGVGVVKSGPTEEEIKTQQFEIIKELLDARNKFDTWILNDDPEESITKKETKTPIDINSKKDLMEIVEEKKRKMKKQSIRDIQKAESSRRNPPTLPFYF